MSWNRQDVPESKNGRFILPYTGELETYSDWMEAKMQEPVDDVISGNQIRMDIIRDSRTGGVDARISRNDLPAKMNETDVNADANGKPSKHIDVIPVNGDVYKGSSKGITNIETSSNEHVVYPKGVNGSIAVAEKNEDKKEEDGGKDEKISILQMFRYADPKDYLLLFLGALFACVSGCCFPVNMLVYGEVLTGFIYYDQIQKTNMTATKGANLRFDYTEYDDVLERTRFYAIYFVLVGVTAFVAGYLQITFWSIATERQMRTIRKRFYRGVMRQEISWFDTHDTGEIGARFASDIHDVSEGLGDKVAIGIQYLAMFIGLYIVALVQGWKLTLVVLAFSPIFVVAGTLTALYSKNLNKKEAKSYSKAGSIAEEVFSSIRTVTAFGGQDKEFQRYNENLKKAETSSAKRGMVSGLGNGVFWSVGFAMFAVAFWYGIKLVRDGEPGFEPGETLTVLLSIMLGSQALSIAVPSWESMSIGRAAMARVYSMIEQTSSIDCFSEAGEKLGAVEGRLELRNVSFTYPSRPDTKILEDLNLEVAVGKVVAVVGSSGSGKSTIVQLIQRFYDVDKGQVLLDGKNIKDFNVEWLRKQIGVVSQEPVLFGTTISENIRYGRMDVSEEEIKKAAQDANAHDFISHLPDGYETLVGERGSQLSGGQKQRIAIARALVRNPKVLLLDEATSALDNESEAIVQKALEKAEEGRTTLVVAHRLSTIRNADCIVVLRDGSKVEQGTHTQLMERRGVYYGLVNHQMHHETEDADEEVLEEIEHSLVDFSKDKDHPPKPGPTQPLSNEPVEKEEDKEKEEKDAASYFSMKRVLRMNSPEWYLIAIGLLFSLAMGGLMPSLAILMSEFLSVFTDPPDEQNEKALRLMGILLGVDGFSLISRIIINVTFTIAGTRLTLRIRQKTFQAIVNQDIAFFDEPRNRVGILATRLARDAALIQGSTGAKIGNMVESITTVLTAVIIAFIYSWKLSLVVLAFLPIMIVAGVLQGKLISGFSRADKGLLEEMGQLVVESVDNIRTVASLTVEKTFCIKYDILIGQLASKGIKRAFISGILHTLTGAVVFFSYAATFTYGAHLIQNEGLDFYLVMRVFIAIVVSGMMVGRNASLQQDFHKGKTAAGRLFHLIDEKPSIDISTEDGQKQEKYSGSIMMQNVEYHYKQRPETMVLTGLSLDVQPGETLALVGASGCGKSTIISLVERFYDVTDGIVMADKQDIRSLNLKWYRSQIGLVSQEPVLFDCSIAENIAYGDNSRVVPMDEIISAARRANIHNFIQSIPQGYDTNVGDKGAQLSGGQKQRVAIARALLRNPKVLLLDEATSALDSESEKIVQEALDRAREGRTCIVIAHRLSTIQHADKIAIIHKGEVKELGTHSELMTRKGIYYRLLQAQNRNK